MEGVHQMKTLFIPLGTINENRKDAPIWSETIGKESTVVPRSR